jgi:hypothetical protein
VVRVRCGSCGTTHALLPSDVVAYCQYSLTFLWTLYGLVLLESTSVPHVATTYGLSPWSVYLVLRRYERCLPRVALVLGELGQTPEDHQRFGARESLERIRGLGLERFVQRYWHHNRRYLWQSRHHARASPPVVHGRQEIGRGGFTEPVDGNPAADPVDSTLEVKHPWTTDS